MKRKDLIHHLSNYGCRLLREGSKHSVFENTTSRKISTLPRHSIINDLLVRKICKDLDIPQPEKR